MAVNALTTAMTRKLDDFTRAYIEAALWSSNDNSRPDGDPLDRNYNADGIAAETLREIIKDCQAFQEKAGDMILEDEEQAGYDFWLTRNHHGAGFWDGDWPEEQEDQLTSLAKEFGEYDLEVYQGIIYGYKG